MRKDVSHIARIEQDLKRVGVTKYGLLKTETAELPRIIAVDEIIYGCIYGRYKGSSAMMVATDRRVLFLDKKPLHLMTEEMTFDKVIDIGADWQSFYSRVTVNTRAGQYVFTYVNTKCARIFISYLESAVLGLHLGSMTRDDKEHHYQVTVPKNFSLEESQFLADHSLCVISTAGSDGYPYGATMFYVTDSTSNNTIRLVTKSSTQSAQNIRIKKRIALTITDPAMFATMHIAGEANLEGDSTLAFETLQRLLIENTHIPKNTLPPIAQIKDGSYVVMNITVTKSYLKTYKM